MLLQPKPPTHNSAGRQLTANSAALEAFWKWHGEGKVIEQGTGKPVMLFHGTTGSITRFHSNKPTDKDAGWYGRGIYFTADPHAASAYSKFEELQGGELSGAPHVIPVYVRVQNPYIWPDGKVAFTDPEESIAFTQYLVELGHDGVIVPNRYAAPEYESFYEVIAFSPDQIKSAVGNPGSFCVDSDHLTDGHEPVTEYEHDHDERQSRRYRP
jgi:hypothetical protein